jgi:hypothetical protein
LPDGLFSYRKSQFGYISEGLGMENVDIFHDHLEYFKAAWYFSRLYDTVSGHLVHFSCFGMFGQRKIWQPLFRWPFDEKIVCMF